VSPDGKWLAFTLVEGSQRSIWMQAFPGGGERRQILGAAGEDPSWSPDQRELFYIARDGTVMAVPVTTTDKSWTSGAPVALFKTTAALLDAVHPLAVSPDGQRFLVSVRAPVPDAITVVLNWTSLLR
jgi:Tol biopolymer transport system component